MNWSYLGECFATFGMIVRLLDMTVGSQVINDVESNEIYLQNCQNIFKSLYFSIQIFWKFSNLKIFI